MAKKEPIYRGLADLTVQIEDSSVASPDYFKIVNLPFEFTAGPNLFKFRGNASLFNENSEVYVEILDSNNDPIYHEVDLDEESDPKAAVVVVYINQDTAPGPAKIILCTSAYKDINNNLLDTSKINVRWTGAVYVDVSRINPAEIVFSKLPTINVTNSTGSYVNYGYALGERVVSQSVTGLRYLFSGRTPVLITGSNCTIGFTTSSLYASVDIPFISGSSYYPSIPGTVATLFPSQSTQIYKSNIVGFNGKGIAYLQTPMTFELVNNNTLYRPNSVNIITASINYTQQNSSAESSQNTYNYATVFFSGLAPQIGIVAKIRSYYKSTGIGEYILSNETDILDQSIELGFTIDVVTASFALPTIQRNDRIDFKFEFVNPIGLVSKQYVESLNNLYLGGNTYIGGDDNLLTGSLFVAGATGTGVEITGKGSSAMVRSIGYQGFKNAIDNNGGQYSGFVIYSGSVQTILGADEQYSGVGLELVANTSSYFKYASANGGLLDIKTNSFFLGSTSQYVSGSDGNIAISSSNFYLDANGNVTLRGSITVTNTDDYTTPRAKSTYMTALISTGSFASFASDTDPIFTRDGYPSAISRVTGSVNASDISSSFDLYVIDHGWGGVNSKAQLILNLFDAGYSVFSSGNDTSVSDTTGSAGSEWPIINAIAKADNYFTFSSKATGIGGISPNDPIGFGWTQFYTIADGDSGALPTKLKTNMNGASTCVPLAISGSTQANDVPDLNTSAAYVAFYATNPRGGRWVHTNARQLSYGLHPSASVKLLDFLYRRDNAQEAYHDGFTKITGNMIQTGKIQSTNWTIGGTVGSEFNLNNGTFKLGGDVDPEFSWDGTNLRVSGSSTELITPSFFLGDKTTSISGSDGNILISGSNVKISTPSFILGVKGIPSSSYVSGSSGNLELYSNRFILTTTGIVTASGVFVPKAFFTQGSSGFQGVPSFADVGYGTGIYPMIEPDKVFVDATNIGRVASPSDPTAHYRYFNNSFNVSSTIFKSCSFHTMANENAYVVPLHFRAQVFGTAGDVYSQIHIYAQVYYTTGSSIVSGHGGGFLTSGGGGSFDNWTLYQDIPIFSLSSFPPFYVAGSTYDRVVTGRNLKQFPIPPAITGSGGHMQLKFRYTIGGGTGNPACDLYARHIEVLTGRQIGLNFKKYIINSPEYGSIKSVGTVPPGFSLGVISDL